MGYALYLAPSWIAQLQSSCQAYGLDYYGTAAQIMVESSWNPEAKGDYVGNQPTSWGLGQVSMGAAQDVGYGGITPEELMQPMLNIQIMTAYMVWCRVRVPKLDKSGWIAQYGLWYCALSMYNQGYGNFATYGPERNRLSYLEPIQAWAGSLQEGGIWPNDGSVAGPAPGVPPPHAPGEPPTGGGDLDTMVSKWAQAINKTLDDAKRMRPWPPVSEYHTTLGICLYGLASLVRELRITLTEWLGQLD